MATDLRQETWIEQRDFPWRDGVDACVRNTPIAVWYLERCRQLGLSERQLLRNFPELTSADLAAAWAYAADHPQEIAAAIFRGQSFVLDETWDLGRIAAVVADGQRRGVAEEAIRAVFVPRLTVAQLVGARAYLASGAPLKDFPRPIWFPGLTADSWIMKTPGTCSGRACIRLTRISVSDLVERWDLGCTDADILEQLPALDQGDLDTARDYARQHPEEIARAIWLNQTWVEGHGGEPAAIAPILAEGRRLGLTDATISTVFDPPLTPELLTRADALLAAQPGGGV